MFNQRDLLLHILMIYFDSKFYSFQTQHFNMTTISSAREANINITLWYSLALAQVLAFTDRKKF